MQTSLNSLAEIENVSVGNSLKHIGGHMPATAAPSTGASEAAIAKFGNVTKYVKWGGRVLLVVAVASDLFEIYNSENKPKTITKIAGGWAGACAGTEGGATVGAWFAGWGAIPGGIIGGIVGYFAGRKITETVYDCIFTKEK